MQSRLIYLLAWIFMLVSAVQAAVAGPATAVASGVDEFPQRSHGPAEQVLVLFSGARQTPMERGIEEGLRSELGRDRTAELTPFYLDMIDRYQPERAELLGATLAQQYLEGRRYAAVVVIGASATTFIRHWRERVVPGVPLLLDGPYADTHAVPGRGMHLLQMPLGFDRTAELIADLRPGVTRLWLITGQGEQDATVRAAALQQLQSFSARFRVEDIHDFTAAELLEQVAHLPDDVALLYGSVSRDLAGEVFLAPNRFSEKLAARSRVPMFCAADWVVEYGGCAGGVVAAEPAGVAALGRVLHRMLAHTGALDRGLQVSVLNDQRSVLRWDAQQRWSIEPERLPAGVEVRGRPLTLLDTHPGQVFAALVVMGLLCAVIALLVRTLRQNRRQRNHLATQEQRWSFALEGAGHGVWDWHLDTGQVYYSRGWLRLLGLDGPVAGHLQTRLSRIVAEDHELVARYWQELTGTVEGLGRCEYRMEHADGHELWVLECAKVVECDAAGLPRRIVATVEDITEQRRQMAQIEYLATHDGLTGLPNRSILNDRLTQELAHARRTQGRFALLYLDLDHFKHVNDSCGHHCGDQLLITVAERLQHQLRDTDTITRQGGDEFLILVSAITAAADAARVCEKLQAALARPLPLQGRELRISASMGIALFPDDATEAEHLLQQADAALYKAKSSGRGGYCFYSEALNQELHHRLLLEGRMREGLRRGEFQLWYQPQFDLRDGHLYGAEALMRWILPNGTQVSPQEFIPVAEEFGHIHELGTWALTQACVEAVRWSHLAQRPISVAVNLSALQFRRSGLADEVAQVLERTGLSPDCLILEITESVVMENAPAIMKIIAALARQGVRFSIDDFGTGYSSLAYLKRFPVHHLKIDRAFITDLGIDPNDEVIVRTIIQLGHSMGMEVIAEGVEVPSQDAVLRRLGCEYVQGYHYGRPLPAEEFVRLLPGRQQVRQVVNAG